MYLAVEQHIVLIKKPFEVYLWQLEQKARI